MIGRWLQSPALHMLALGALLSAAVGLRDSVLPAAKPRLEVASYRLQQARVELIERNAREPTDDEWEQVRQILIDDELLFQYALSLRLWEDSAVKARLALIAEFVDADPSASTRDELVRSAMELGLHDSDLVARRILVDRARRLIRSVSLMQPVPAERVEQYFAEHSGEYVEAARVGLSQVTVNGFKWPDTEARARELRARIDREQLDFASAMALGDASVVPPALPLATAHELESRMGSDFAAAVLELSVEQWSAPIPSRFGHHLVFVQERQEARMPSLDEVRVQVEQRVRQQLADEWLAQRLQQMRGEYEIIADGGVS